MKWLDPQQIKVSMQTQAPAQQGPSNVTYTSASKGGWQLVYQDDFERQQLGEARQIHEGQWALEDGHLTGSGILSLSTEVLGAAADNYQRLEFVAITDDTPQNNTPAAQRQARYSDMSAFLHAKHVTDKNLLSQGYFFQFGGFWNTRHRLLQNGHPIQVDLDPKTRITPGAVHRVVVENDQGHLKLFVNEQLILDHASGNISPGPGQSLAGFYFHTRFKVDHVKLFMKLTNDLDL